MPQNSLNSTKTSLKKSRTKLFELMRPKFKIFGHNHKCYIWGGVNNAHDEKYTMPTVKHRGGSLMFLGCMSYTGTGNLSRIHGKMNAACYQKILKGKVHLSSRKLYMGRSWTFQHDNDPKHKAKSTAISVS